MKKAIFTFIFTLLLSSVFAQDVAKKESKFYLYWGYNRANYTNTNMHFTGDNYDFTLDKVSAKDRQSDPSLHYLLPQSATIPQYNFRLGYYLKDDISISIGTDHMKYVMVEDQTVKINGEIDANSSVKYNGSYDNDDVKLLRDFLQFEHTDGLNYVNIEASKIFNLLDLKEGKVKLDYSIGGGLGVIIPRSDVTLLDYETHDKFHLAGIGIAPKNSLAVTFFDMVFFKYVLKAGYINMFDVRTTYSKSDKAKHSFFFLERFGTLGVNIKI